VDRINEQIGEILEFTQGSGDGVALSPVNFAGFVRPVVDELGVDLEQRGVAIHLENEPPSVKILMNPARLRRVFQNLLHGAAEAMPDGGVAMLRFTLKAGRVITEIEDTGPGIPQEIAAKIFEPFATYGQGQGTGLGPSICKRIIEDHHGRIWTESRPGRGAVFVFSLPRPS
jgi:signal transduction histidine kinase